MGVVEARLDGAALEERERRGDSGGLQARRRGLREGDGVGPRAVHDEQDPAHGVARCLDGPVDLRGEDPGLGGVAADRACTKNSTLPEAPATSTP